MLPDGTLELIVTGKATGPRTGLGLGDKMFILCFVWSWIYFSSVTDSAAGGLVLGLSLSALIFFIIYSLFVWKKSTVHARANGIEIDGGKKRIALSDLTKVGVKDLTMQDNKGRFAQSSYVFAEALGQEVKITPNVDTPIAAAVHAEIVKYYNF